MSSIKEYIIKKIEERKEEYKAYPIRIVPDYNFEKSTLIDYEGRQLLEMIQNADDASSTDKEKTCYIELTEDNRLIIANNGKGFDEIGIDSLMESHISGGKQDDENSIGEKGLGFRSILSWAKNVTIKSNDFAIEFSEENAKSVLEELIKQKPSIKEEIYKHEKEEKYPIATLRCPKLIDIKDEYSDYDTYIVISLRDYVKQNVEKQIADEIKRDNVKQNVEKQIADEIKHEVLLFLNNLTSIEVKTPSEHFCFSKEMFQNNSIVKITKKDFLSNSIEEKEWTVSSEKGQIGNKNYELKAAWNDKLTNDVNVVYNYFRTEVNFKFPCMIHGTFKLKSDRSDFTEDDYNSQLTEKLIDFIIKTALSIAKNEISYKPLSLLNIKDIDNYFVKRKFVETLHKKIKESKLFPSISNKYITANDNPRTLFKHNYASLLPPKSFPALLKHTENKEIKEFLEELEIQEYDQPSLFNILSEVSKKFDIDERCKLIKYLYDDYCKGKPENWPPAPSLLINKKGKVISNDEKKYRISKESKMPKDESICIVKPSVIENLNNNNIFTWFGIEEYTPEVTLQRIIDQYNSRLETAPDADKKEIVKETLLDLYNFYKNTKNESRQIWKGKGDSIFVINRSDEIVPATKTYFGKEYDCNLCETLFHYKQDCFIAAAPELGLIEEDAFKFLKCLGVADMPRRITKESVEEDYKKKLFSDKDYWPQTFKCKVSDIEDINSILENNSNETILWWLCEDKGISSEEGKEFDKNSYYEIDRKHQRGSASQRFNNSEMDSYILWKIRHTEWMKTKTGKKVKPTSCCTSKITDYFEKPEIDYNSPMFKDNRVEEKDIKTQLKSIGVKTSINDYDPETIYKILLNLPKESKDGEKATEFYKVLANNYKRWIDKKGQSCSKFLKEGRVFCSKNNGKESGYVSKSEAYCRTNGQIYEDIIKDFWVLDLPPRFSTQINDLFEVKTLPKFEITVKKFEPNSRNEDFIQKLKFLKPYYYALKAAKDENETKLKKIKSLKITICSELNAEYLNGEQKKPFTLFPYEWIHSDNQYYILIGNDDTDRPQLADKVAEIISDCFSEDITSDNNKTDLYARLFDKYGREKDLIYILEKEGYGKESISKAKERMGISEDDKTIFLSNDFSAKGDNPLEYNVPKEELTSIVQNKVGISNDDYNIDYEEKVKTNEENNERNPLDIHGQLPEARKTTKPEEREQLTNTKNSNPASNSRKKEDVDYDRENGNDGKDGEEWVYNNLKKEYEEVEWVSRFAKENGENIEGNDNNHYDIKYKDKDGKWIYVDVKTTTRNRKYFLLTEPEVDFGKKMKDRYKVIHLTNLNNKTQRYDFTPFAEEDFMHSEKFEVEYIYKFKYKEEEEIFSI